MVVCAGFIFYIYKKRNQISTQDTQDGVSSSSQRVKEMLLLLYRGYTPSVGSSVVNHSKCIFYVCARVCESVTVSSPFVRVMKEWLYTRNVFIECIIFQRSIREL